MGGADRGIRSSDPEYGAPNPHLWLSVKQGKIIAQKIARFLAEADPEGSGRYELNLFSYAKKLDAVDKTTARLFKSTKNRSFIQWHEAWNYLADDYGLSIAGTVQREGSDKASVRSIKEIVERAKKNRVTVIVVSLAAEARTARVLAREIRGTIAQLDGIGNPDEKERSDYLKLMLYNASRLAEALRR